MPNDQIFITTYILQRIMKQLAQRLIPDESFADILVQRHLQETNLPQTWSAFLWTNCARCRKEPDTCMFLNPTDQDVRGAAIPGGTRAAVATGVETGTFVQCPAQDLAPERGA